MAALNPDQADQALERFAEFAVGHISDDNPQKPALHYVVAQKLSEKPQDVKNVIDHFLVPLQQQHQAIDQHISVVEQLRQQADAAEGQNRQRGRQLRGLYEALRLLAHMRQQSHEATQQLVEQYIAQAGFDEAIVEMCRTRTAQALAQLQQVHEFINVVVPQIVELEERPGLNPRKVPYRPDGNRIAAKTRADIMQAPFEPQGGPSDIEPGNWQFACILGGGMAQAALWVNVDSNGRIRNRIVRKDTHIDPPTWTDATRWHGDLRDLANRIPMEYHCQKLLQDRPEAEYMVRALKCEVDIKNMVYRLYLPYCPYGDLSDLIEAYEKSDRLFSEPFLWRVFEALVHTGLIMERGAVDEEQPRDWLQIVHRDLKPANVFLDLQPEEGRPFPHFPVPKLADFGLSCQTFPNDPLNPMIYGLGCGTPGYLPPEQRPYMDSQTGERVDAFKLLAHTNVWGVGMIMWTLAYRQEVMPFDQPNFLPTNAAVREDEFPVFHIEEFLGNSQNAALLSETLKETISKCMKFDPSERPSFEELKDIIDDAMEINQMDGGLGAYMFDASNGQQEPNAAYDVFGLVDSKYKLGFAYSGPVGPEHAGLAQESKSSSLPAGEGAEWSGHPSRLL